MTLLSSLQVSPGSYYLLLPSFFLGCMCFSENRKTKCFILVVSVGFFFPSWISSI